MGTWLLVHATPLPTAASDCLLIVMRDGYTPLMLGEQWRDMDAVTRQTYDKLAEVGRCRLNR